MREFAVRAALGATRTRVVRQLLTESVLLALAGGVLGLLFAAWGTRVALGVLPTALPRAEEIGLDARVLIFTMGISFLAGIFFGLTPALRTSRPDLQATLKEGGRGASGTRHRAQGIFVVVEMAMALVLLIGAGLMIRSLTQLWQVDPGFDPHNVLTFSLSMPPSMMAATPDAIRAQIRTLDNKLASVPGVRAASLSWGSLPMSGDEERMFWVEGQPKPNSENDMNWTLAYIVGPDYLKTMGIPLERGRFLTTRDNEHSARMIAIDEVFARKFFPSQDPVGKRINMNGYDAPVEIVGVVRHVKQWGLDSDDNQELRAQMYLPFMQLADEAMALVPSGMSVVVRSNGEVPALLDSIRHASEQMSSEQVIYDAQTMSEIISASLAQPRFSMILLGAFAALALVLASVGIYGVISYSVGQRTHEIGIRMALGAQPLHIVRLVLREGGALAVTGVALGLASALGLTRLMAGLLYGVHATDPLTFAGVAVLLTLVALAACYIPARRATKVDPMVALRYE
jgi:predicted permease